jgi:hypothetical protein
MPTATPASSHTATGDDQHPDDQHTNDRRVDDKQVDDEQVDDKPQVYAAADAAFTALVSAIEAAIGQRTEHQANPQTALAAITLYLHPVQAALASLMHDQIGYAQDTWPPEPAHQVRAAWESQRHVAEALDACYTPPSDVVLATDHTLAAMAGRVQAAMRQYHAAGGYYQLAAAVQAATTAQAGLAQLITTAVSAASIVPAEAPGLDRQRLDEAVHGAGHATRTLTALARTTDTIVEIV